MWLKRKLDFSCRSYIVVAVKPFYFLSACNLPLPLCPSHAAFCQSADVLQIFIWYNCDKLASRGRQYTSKVSELWQLYMHAACAHSSPPAHTSVFLLAVSTPHSVLARLFCKEKLQSTAKKNGACILQSYSPFKVIVWILTSFFNIFFN